MGGIKNQLRPDEHREELEKWRCNTKQLPARIFINNNLPSTSKKTCRQNLSFQFSDPDGY